MSRRLQNNWKDRLQKAVPFGLAARKPRHFLDMLKIAWQNRDNAGYAWKVLSKGVCDGCALGVAGFHDWTIDGVHLCMTRLNLLRLNTARKFDPALLADVGTITDLSNTELRELGRIPCPMLRRKGENGFTPISWDDAIQRIAARINASTPERIAFYLTSRGITNEVYYVAQKAARCLGTNNIDNAARLCHSPSTGAMKYALGIAASTCSYSDWIGSDLIVFFGANPANDQPVTTKYLHEARTKGTRVVLVNPYLEPGMRRYWVPSNAKSALFGTDIADYWFPVSQGGDIAFLYGVIKILIERGWVDEAFIRDHTVAYEELRAHAAGLDLEALATASGLSSGDMLEFAELLHQARTAIFVWSMGITQHTHGGDGVSMILNLGLLRGYVGRDHCGLVPIRGHSGVQGGAEMGAYATAFPGGKTINEEHAAELSNRYGFPVPNRPGMPATEMVAAAGRGDLDLLYCAGGNFLRALPDPDAVARCMRSVPLRVHQDIILTDQMFIEPGEEVILLPAKTRYEQDGGGTETTTERRVVLSPELPRSEEEIGSSRAEWRILRDIALAARPQHAATFGCDSGEAIRREIAEVVPFYDGIQKLHKGGDQFQYGGRHLGAGGKFQTADGKAHFRIVPLPGTKPGSGEFIVSTRRGKQFNTLIYAETDPLTGASRDAVFIHPEDIQQLQLAPGGKVRLANEFGQMVGTLFAAPITRGNLQVHWPEGNVLLPTGPVDELGGVPDYNVRVRIEKV
ncbi:MAG TPA: formate dehydrogenase [Verrucomicrobiales bacterium]|nr:formate dehydrogenase [Verrucomicrobiales bacterium]